MIQRMLKTNKPIFPENLREIVQKQFAYFCC